MKFPSVATSLRVLDKVAVQLPYLPPHEIRQPSIKLMLEEYTPTSKIGATGHLTTNGRVNLAEISPNGKFIMGNGTTAVSERRRDVRSTLVGAAMNSSYFSSSTMVFTRISHSEDHTELENLQTVRCEASLARGPTCQSQAAEKSLYPIPKTNVCCQGPCVSPSASSRYSFACASPSIAL